METPFAKEKRWHDQQARWMEQDCEAERYERFYVPTDAEVRLGLDMRRVLATEKAIKESRLFTYVPRR
jgi:hypothetical protein